MDALTIDLSRVRSIQLRGDPEPKMVKDVRMAVPQFHGPGTPPALRHEQQEQWLAFTVGDTDWFVPLSAVLAFQRTQP
jgi:hypothetical protein